MPNVRWRDEFGKVRVSSDCLKWECIKAREEQKTSGIDIDQERELVREKQEDIKRHSKVDILVVPGFRSGAE